MPRRLSTRCKREAHMNFMQRWPWHVSLLERGIPWPFPPTPIRRLRQSSASWRQRPGPTRPPPKVQQDVTVPDSESVDDDNDDDNSKEENEDPGNTVPEEEVLEVNSLKPDLSMSPSSEVVKNAGPVVLESGLVDNGGTQ